MTGSVFGPRKVKALQILRTILVKSLMSFSAVDLRSKLVMMNWKSYSITIEYSRGCYLTWIIYDWQRLPTYLLFCKSPERRISKGFLLGWPKEWLRNLRTLRCEVNNWCLLEKRTYPQGWSCRKAPQRSIWQIKLDGEPLAIGILNEHGEVGTEEGDYYCYSCDQYDCEIRGGDYLRPIPRRTPLRTSASSWNTLPWH